MAELPSRLLRDWLQRQLPEAAFDWLAGQLEALRQDPGDRKLHVALGMIPRRLGKDDLALSVADLRAAEAARPGWDPRDWSADEAARVLALLAAAGANTGFAARFTQLCGSAEVGEAIALYRGLPLYPDPGALEDQAAEGLRTNMRAVFEAVAHDNPYPRDYFDENRWNQMVLKALFIGSTLDPIVGLDARANAALAAMLGDYVHEPWAAGRPVTPELWRCVGPFAEGAALRDLERALDSADEPERCGAALALAASPSPEAKEILSSVPDLSGRIERGDLTWPGLAAEL
ncbi:MAG: EboA domain-containing protein [Kiloniellales bacterium]|nr:EboA domain-containing protein [Kiloniellales bacterium]